MKAIESFRFERIYDRLTRLEQRVFKTDSKEFTSRSVQMLLLKHLGVLDLLNKYDIPNTKKAKLLSYLLNASESNIESDFTIIYKEKSDLRTSKNYRSVTKIFKKSGLNELAEETDIILDEILKEE